MSDLTFRLIWPIWALVIVLGPLLGLTVWQAVRHRGARRLDWCRRGAIVGALAVIGLGPAMPEPQSQTVQSNAEVFFVVDRTGSMAAEDWNGGQPRLDGVRHDLVALTEAMAGARYSIIAFDSRATRQLPLTTDSRAVRSWAETLRQENTNYSAGSMVDRPLDALTQALVGAAERNPENVRIVFFLSDGENTDGSDSSTAVVPRSFAELAPLIDGGAVLGYGTAQGAPMRFFDGTAATGAGTDGPFIIDPATGEPAISRMDEAQLRTLASQMGVDFAARSGPTEVTSITGGISVEDIAGDGRRELSTLRDVHWPVSAVLLALLAWEALVVARAFPRTAASSGPREKLPLDGVADGDGVRAHARESDVVGARSGAGLGAGAGSQEGAS